MKSSDHIRSMLRDFAFIDCRLEDHPKVLAGLYWLKKEEGMLVLAAKTGGLGRPSDAIARSPVHGSASGSLSSIRDVLDNRAYSIGSHDEPYYRSLLAVPILEAENPIGVLAFSSLEPGYFEEKHMGLAQLLAALIAYSEVHLERKVKLVSPASVSLGRALRQVREELQLTQETLAARMSTSRIAMSRWENGAQPPSRGQLDKWCKSLGLLMPNNPTIVRCVDITPSLLRFLKEDPTRLHELSPAQLEQLVAERLDRMGFDVTLTGSAYARDGGIDLIAVPKTRTVGTLLLAGQIKHHRGDQKTGRQAVDRLLSWKDSCFNLGLLVTNTGFTKDALWVATRDKNRAFLRLRDFQDLVKWIEDNFWSEEEWREIPDKVTLAPGVTIEIPKPRLSNSLEIWPIESLDLKHEPGP